jgi:hypothetical protein
VRVRIDEQVHYVIDDRTTEVVTESWRYVAKGTQLKDTKSTTRNATVGIDVGVIEVCASGVEVSEDDCMIL